VLSADPRRVPEAFLLPEVSYYEAMELATFGAKVIHPLAMTPALRGGIPIFIKNSFAPGAGSTRIFLPSDKTEARQICGFSTVDGLSLLNVEGAAALEGVPGIAARLFGKVAERGISVNFVAQTISEQSICIAVKTSDAFKTVEAIRSAFRDELESGLLNGKKFLQPRRRQHKNRSHNCRILCMGSFFPKISSLCTIVR